jgi:hypothetical protein
MRFENLDRDGCGTVTFKELQYGLGRLGFSEFDKLSALFNRVKAVFKPGDKLAALFKLVDADGNGVLDFFEFIVLIYNFSVERGDLSFMFSFRENAKMVNDSFSMMHKALCLFDKAGKNVMNIEEVRPSYTTHQRLCVYASMCACMCAYLSMFRSSYVSCRRNT